MYIRHVPAPFSTTIHRSEELSQVYTETLTHLLRVQTKTAPKRGKCDGMTAPALLHIQKPPLLRREGVPVWADIPTWSAPWWRWVWPYSGPARSSQPEWAEQMPWWAWPYPCRVCPRVQASSVWAYRRRAR